MNRGIRAVGQKKYRPARLPRVPYTDSPPGKFDSAGVDGLEDLVQARTDATRVGGFPEGRASTLFARLRLLHRRATRTRIEVLHGLARARIGNALEVVVADVADAEDVSANTGRVSLLRRVVRLRDAALVVEGHARVVG